MTKKMQLERIDKALEVMKGIQSGKGEFQIGEFDMSDWAYPIDPHSDSNWTSSWMRKHLCGTAACFAGTLSLHPWFRRRGLKLDRDGFPSYRGEIVMSAIGGFFGIDWGEASFLCSPVSCPGIDDVVKRLENLREQVAG